MHEGGRWPLDWEAFQRGPELRIPATELGVGKNQPSRSVCFGASDVRAMSAEGGGNGSGRSGGRWPSVNSMTKFFAAAMSVPGFAPNALPGPALDCLWDDRTVSGSGGERAAWSQKGAGEREHDPLRPRLDGDRASLADCFLSEPFGLRAAVLEGATDVVLLRSKPDGKPTEKVHSIAGLPAPLLSFDSLVLSRGLRKRGYDRAATDAAMRQHVQVYVEDLKCAELGGSSGKRVDVPLPLGFVDERTPPSATDEADTRTQQAYVLPVTPPPAAAELGQIDHDRARVLDAMREGYASVLVTLADPDGAGGLGEITREEALDAACRQITDASWCTATEVAIDGIRIDRRHLDGISYDEVLNVTSSRRA